jgi:glycosyltransferase involved in cell wall biosynthesis
VHVRFGRRPRRAAFRYLAEDAPSGYGDAADRLVRAVRASGVRVEYRAWPGRWQERAPKRARDHSRDPLPEERAPRGAPTIAHLVPERVASVRKATRGPLIAHTVWETDRLPSDWPGLLDHLDRIIVPTSWNQEIFVASGVTAPVVVVPHVVCDPVPGDGGVPFDLPSDVVAFYTIGRWDQRKAPAAVIRAFLDAFTADDPVALIVKTSPRAQFPAPGPWGGESELRGTTVLEVARIMREYPRAPRVLVDADDWPPSRVAGLHTRGDCYVSLAHGEGWGLGAFDAAAYGNPVIMTGWGGQLEYLDDDGAFLVDYDLEPVRHWEPTSYAPDQHWAVPRHEHAVELLREIAADLGAARRRAAPLRAKVLHDYAPARVAATLFDVVPELGVATPTISSPGAPPAPTRRGRARAEEPLLVGLTVGPWQPAFDNWVEMADRHGYAYELVGVEVAEPYIPHATKWKVLADFLADLPRDRLIFYLDAADAFVCDAPSHTLARYRAYSVPLLVGAEPRRRGKGYDVPDPTWRFGNTGAFIGEAGIAADALRKGYELQDWDEFGHVSDQRAMNLYLQRPGNEHLATIDYRRTIVMNIAASESAEVFEQHRELLDHEVPRPPTSSVHFYGGNGPGYNLFARLYGLTPVPLRPEGRFRVTESTNPGRPVPVATRPSMPRLAHFVFDLGPNPDDFHFVHYLTIASCLATVQPDEVHVHCHHEPSGPYWDLLASSVVVHPVKPDAHDADMLRLDVLAEHGGLYADLDTLFVGRFPERLWRAPFVIGREADVPDGTGLPRPALSNALLMSQPGSAFVEAWRAELRAANRGRGANDRRFLAQDLALRLPHEVHVEPQRTFHAFEPTPSGIELLVGHATEDLDGVATIHLGADRWSSEGHPETSTLHAGVIDEQWIRSSDSTYATAARPFLPKR